MASPAPAAVPAAASPPPASASAPASTGQVDALSGSLSRKRRSLASAHRRRPWYPSVGAEVEALIDEQGFRGSAYEATVVLVEPRFGRCEIVYKTLLSEDGTGSMLREPISMSHLRPSPPCVAADSPRSFVVYQLVEAFHQDGWWRGVISAEPDEQGEYEVSFPMSGEVVRFKPVDIRPRLEWDGRRWVSPETMTRADPVYNEGAAVEVWRDMEPYGISWFTATVLKVIGRMYFLVSYDNWHTEEESSTEILDSSYLRPRPSMLHLKEVKMGSSADVEAFCDGGWSRGVISMIIRKEDSFKYEVKMNVKKGNKPVFVLCDAQHVRPRFEWVNGEWKSFSKKRNASKSKAFQSPPSAQSSNSKSIESGPLEIKKHRPKRRPTESFAKPKRSKKAAKMANSKTPTSSGQKKHGSITAIMNGEVIRDEGLNTALVPKVLNEPSLYSDDGSLVPIQQSLVALQDVIPIKALTEPSLCSDGSFIPLQPSLVMHKEVIPIEAEIKPSPCSEGSLIPLQQSLVEPQDVIPTDAVIEPSNLKCSSEGMEGLESTQQETHLLPLQQNCPESRHGGPTMGMGNCSTPVSNGQIVHEPITSEDNVHGSIGRERNNAHISKDLDPSPCSDDGSRMPLQDSPVARHDVTSIEAPTESCSERRFPFEKTFSMWDKIETMEVFKRPPQRPHFQQLQQTYPKSLHEGLAFGLMMTFSSCAESIPKLQLKDGVKAFEEKRVSLDALESNGFNVQFLRSHLCGMIRSRLAESTKLADRLEQTIREKENEMAELDSSIHELDYFRSLLKLRLDLASLRRSCNNSELSALREEFDEARTYHDEAARLVSTIDASLCCNEAQA